MQQEKIDFEFITSPGSLRRLKLKFSGVAQGVSKIFCAEVEGITPYVVEVETDIHIGLSSFNIVGLADKAVSEARERVSSALKNSKIKPPTRENRKVTVNLAPADLKKNGSQYDLAIALGYLLASQQIKSFDTKRKIFLGELSLNGELRPVRGVFNICQMAKEKGFESVFVPWQNAKEAAFVKGINIYPVFSLVQLINHLEEKELIQPLETQEFFPERFKQVDFSEIKGQEVAKRALSIAAAGGHNLFMSGPPGAGKTMLAQSLISILPNLSFEEALEITQIYSAAGLLTEKPFVSWRPFRAPHHSASLVALIGGGQTPRPGEVSLAHRGVLFLDEIPEFHRDVLESLRQPLEDGKVTISRSRGTLTLPSKFMLVAAANPCPCGYAGDSRRECRCSPYQVIKYQRKISGPLMDRIDIHIWVNNLEISDFKKEADFEETEKIFQKVNRAREIQRQRMKKMNLNIFTNSELSSKQIENCVNLDKGAQVLLEKAMERNFLSARGYFKVLKVARTIADMEESEEVKADFLSEALSYREKVNQ
ncbi:MAG: magnesium chelatase [Candidatus Parcubacteria bacterium]|nr:MAG: magnesium chelatase [Candidatus Parcubacteria bacterium]